MEKEKTLEDVGLDARIILERICEKWGGEAWTVQ